MPRREDVGPEGGPPSAAADASSAPKKVLTAVAAVAAVALALVAALWAVGRDSADGAFAVSGVRAAAAHIDPAALAPSADVETPVDEDELDDGGPEEDDTDDGDAFSDWLAEAEARAKLAAGSHSAGSADSPPAASSARAGTVRDGGPEPPQPPFGHATRLRNIGLQVIAICASGRAAEVKPLALELLQEKPAPWLAKRIRAACLKETEPPPPDEPPPPEEPPEP